MEQICQKCGVSRKIDRFDTPHRGYRRKTCRDCRNTARQEKRGPRKPISSTKTCVSCGGIFPKDDFRRKNGKMRGRCSDCDIRYMQAWHIFRMADAQRRKRFLEQKVAYRKSQNGIQTRLKHYSENKQYYCQKQKARRKLKTPEMKEKARQALEKYRANNRDRIRECNKKYAALHRQQINKRIRQRRLSDPVYRFKERIRNNIGSVYRNLGKAKGGKTFEMLGYTPTDLCNHLLRFVGTICSLCNSKIITKEESAIDHQIPLCIAESCDDIIKLNALSNLRLVCFVCNAMKAKKDKEMKRNLKSFIELKPV